MVLRAGLDIVTSSEVINTTLAYNALVKNVGASYFKVKREEIIRTPTRELTAKADRALSKWLGLPHSVGS
jgi:hypothetical protein